MQIGIIIMGNVKVANRYIYIYIYIYIRTIIFPLHTSYASFIPPLSAMFSFKVCLPLICKTVKRNNSVVETHIDFANRQK